MNLYDRVYLVSDPATVGSVTRLEPLHSRGAFVVTWDNGNVIAYFGLNTELVMNL